MGKQENDKKRRTNYDMEGIAYPLKKSVKFLTEQIVSFKRQRKGRKI